MGLGESAATWPDPSRLSETAMNSSLTPVPAAERASRPMTATTATTNQYSTIEALRSLRVRGTATSSYAPFAVVKQRKPHNARIHGAADPIGRKRRYTPIMALR